MPGITGEEEVAVAHRLADVAAEAQHGLLEDSPLVELQAVRPVDALLQLGPNLFLGPVGRVFIGGTLEDSRWLINAKPCAELQ